MKKIVIFGNSVFAEHIWCAFKHDSGFETVAFTVDEKYILSDKLLGIPVVPFETVEHLFPPSEFDMVVSVSFQKVNRLREEKYLQAKSKGYQLISYVSSRASWFEGLITGENSIILENAIIGAFAEIGNDVIVASGAIIGHHAKIRDHSYVSPGAIILGGAIVEEYCLIGANATIKEEVKVARECVIGSGVSITKNTVERGVYLSNVPELYPKRSDELRKWLMWPLRARQSGRESDRNGI